MTNTAAR